MSQNKTDEEKRENRIYSISYILFSYIVVSDVVKQVQIKYEVKIDVESETYNMLQNLPVELHV